MLVWREIDYLGYIGLLEYYPGYLNINYEIMEQHDSTYKYK